MAKKKDNLGYSFRLGAITGALSLNKHTAGLGVITGLGTTVSNIRKSDSVGQFLKKQITSLGGSAAAIGGALLGAKAINFSASALHGSKVSKFTRAVKSKTKKMKFDGYKNGVRTNVPKGKLTFRRIGGRIIPIRSK